MVEQAPVSAGGEGASAVRTISVPGHLTLADYACHLSLARAVAELKAEAATLMPRLAGRRVVVVNSTEAGGGVAEMLPRQITMLRELGLDVEWVVLGTKRPEFFRLTKRLHNLIHGEGEPGLGPADRELFEAVNREAASALAGRVGPRDVLIVHDPQPLALGAMLARQVRLTTIWRCHIGLDVRSPQTDDAWEFLRPYAQAYDRTVFSAVEYIPDYLAGRSTVIRPALDPLSHKNRELSPHKLVGILCNGGLAQAIQPVLTPNFAAQARRLLPDGRLGPCNVPEDIGLLYRPMVLQVSRWDRLKGFAPLMDAFACLKQDRAGLTAAPDDPRHQRRLDLARLVLAGPDPGGVADDPEGLEVLADLGQRYRKLDRRVQADVALVLLPMASRKENALLVNALQRSANLVVQNSRREGFGLTLAEAMWKGVPVLAGSGLGLRLQVRDGLDGRVIDDSDDVGLLARTLDRMLADEPQLSRWASQGQRRVSGEFLVFQQVAAWLRLLATLPR